MSAFNHKAQGDIPVSQAKLEADGTVRIKVTRTLWQPIDFITMNLTIDADPAVMTVEEVPMNFEGVFEALHIKREMPR